MINLKTEEFVLDMNTLQALQQLLQWVGDFVLYLLASLPNQVRRPAPGLFCPLPIPAPEGPTLCPTPQGNDSCLPLKALLWPYPSMSYLVS
jgi:hypothetical protein